MPIFIRYIKYSWMWYVLVIVNCFYHYTNVSEMRRLVSWINHFPPACWSTFWKSIFKHQLGCRFDILDNISSFFCILTYAIIYVLIHHIIFWLYLYFLNILCFFKYSCPNTFHRSSLCTFYMVLLFGCITDWACLISIMPYEHLQPRIFHDDTAGCATGQLQQTHILRISHSGICIFIYVYTYCINYIYIALYPFVSMMFIPSLVLPSIFIHISIKLVLTCSIHSDSFILTRISKSISEHITQNRWTMDVDILRLML